MLDLLTHIYKTYTVISNAEWLANDKRFREPYLPTVPIEVAWRKIDDALAYSDAGSMPYSSKQVVENLYQLVFDTGIFAADCCEWNNRAANDKTLPNLKVFLWPHTGSGASRFETIPALPTAPHTTPLHTWTTGTCNKMRWTLSRT